MENIKAQFKPDVVTDLSLGYSFSKALSASINANNIFNILPKWDLVGLNSTGTQYLAKAENASFAERVSVLQWSL